MEQLDRVSSILPSLFGAQTYFGMKTTVCLMGQQVVLLLRYSLIHNKNTNQPQAARLQDAQCTCTGNKLRMIKICMRMQFHDDLNGHARPQRTDKQERHQITTIVQGFQKG